MREVAALADVSLKTVSRVVNGERTVDQELARRVHEAIGVFGAVSVATACLVPGSVAAEIIADASDVTGDLVIEHPSGYFTVSMAVDLVDGAVQVRRAALLRTARLLMRGDVFVPSAVWPGR